MAPLNPHARAADAQRSAKASRALVVAALSLASCELFTHADSYSVVTGICAECAEVQGAQAVRRPPCPNLGTPVDPAQGTYLFGWKALSLGTRPFDGGEGDVGEDQDCSDRAWDGGARKGQPVLCVPAPPPSPDSRCPVRFIPSPPWAQAPGGRDNALGQRVLAPLLQFAGGAYDVDAILSAAFAAGRAGQLVKLERWNGQPDDDDILLTYAGTKGVAPLPDGGAATPRWDGTDVWLASRGFDAYPHYKGYVSGGELVVDTRAVGQESVDLNLTDAKGNLINFHITARLMSRVGTLTPEHLMLVSYGRWDLAEAIDQADEVAGFLTGEPKADAGNATRNLLACELPALFRGAADLPLVGSTGTKVNASLVCSAISLALRAEAYPIRVLEP